MDEVRAAVVLLSTGLALLTSACDDREARGSVPAESRVTNPGARGIVDSIHPPEEALRRFRVGLDSAPKALNGPTTREALVRAFFVALDRGDARTLRTLALSKAEFAFLVYPESHLSRRPYYQPPEVAWFMSQTASDAGLGRLLDRLGGGRARYVQHSCGEPETDGTLTLWRACTVRVFVSGEYMNRRLFGTVIEHGGRFKFAGFQTDF